MFKTRRARLRRVRSLATETSIPFVVTASRGGPFDDVSFVAGAQLGTVAACVVASGQLPHRPVLRGLLPQLDLIAMAYGLDLRVHENHGHGHEFVCVEMTPHVMVDSLSPV